MPFNPSPDELGQRIRDERKRLGFSLRNLSKQVGVSISTLSNYEQGHRYASMEFLVKFGERGANIDLILFGKPKIGDGRTSEKMGALTLIASLSDELDHHRKNLNALLESTDASIEHLNDLHAQILARR